MLGSLAAGLAAYLGRRLGGTLASWTAGLAVAICAQGVLYDARLLPVSLSTFLLTLGAAALIRAWDRSATPGLSAWPLVAGLVLGLETTARPTLLLALPFVALAFLVRGRRGVAAMFLLALGAAGPLALTAGHNLVQRAPGVLVSVNGGINLYRGNNPLFLDAPVHPFRLDGSKDALAKKARLIASVENGSWVSYGATDRHWLARTLAEWRADPLRYALLFGRKLSQTLGFRERGDANDVELAQPTSRVLSLLPPLFGPAAILAVVGLATGLAPRRRRPATTCRSGSCSGSASFRLHSSSSRAAIACRSFPSRPRTQARPWRASCAPSSARVVIPAVAVIAAMLVLLVPRRRRLVAVGDRRRSHPRPRATVRRRPVRAPRPGARGGVQGGGVRDGERR